MTYGHALNLTAVCWCGRDADVFEDGRILCARHALDVELRGIVRQDGEGRVFKVRADEVEILSEPAARWADLFGAAPNYTGGVPVDEWLEAHRGEANDE